MKLFSICTPVKSLFIFFINTSQIFPLFVLVSFTFYLFIYYLYALNSFGFCDEFCKKCVLIFLNYDFNSGLNYRSLYPVVILYATTIFAHGLFYVCSILFSSINILFLWFLILQFFYTNFSYTSMISYSFILCYHVFLHELLLFLLLHRTFSHL